jgi:hypothetical protein
MDLGMEVHYNPLQSIFPVISLFLLPTYPIRIILGAIALMIQTQKTTPIPWKKRENEF